MDQNKKRIQWVCLGLILIVAFLFFGKILFPNEKRSSKDNRDLTRASDPSRQLTQGFEDLKSKSYEFDSNFEVDIEQVIEDYTQWSVYPPDSRPLLASHIDVLNPKVISVATQAMPVLINGKVKDSGYSCQLQPEFHTVTEARTLRIFLSCYQTGTDQRRKLTIDSTSIEGRAGKNLFIPPSVSGNDSGTDGDSTARDLVYTFHFRPRISDWGDMSLSINFFIEGDRSLAKHTLTHHFFSSPVAPAYFSGKFSDRLEEGSLFVEAEIQVKEPGRYTIEANLMTETDEPVGYARKDQKLMGGKQIVTLQYFGKIIVNSRESGPYKLTNLRGTLNTDVIQEDMLIKSPEEVDKILSKISDDRPKHKTIPYFEGVYLTASYSLSEFSDREYESAEKRQRIADLQMLRK